MIEYTQVCLNAAYNSMYVGTIVVLEQRWPLFLWNRIVWHLHDVWSPQVLICQLYANTYIDQLTRPELATVRIIAAANGKQYY